MNTKLLEALKHAERRLNEIPHRYKDTDFGLIEEAIKEAEEIIRVGGEAKDSLDHEALRLRNALIEMSNIYSEKRTDVSEMCDNIRAGKEPRKEDSESRYTCWMYEGEQFQYDSLTTLVSVLRKNSDFMEEIDGIEYKDD